MKIEKVDTLPEVGEPCSIYLLNKPDYCTFNIETEWVDFDSSICKEKDIFNGYVYEYDLEGGGHVKSEYLGNGEFLINATNIRPGDGTAYSTERVLTCERNKGFYLENYGSHASYCGYKIISGTMSSGPLEIAHIFRPTITFTNTNESMDYTNYGKIDLNTRTSWDFSNFKVSNMLRIINLLKETYFSPSFTFQFIEGGNTNSRISLTDVRIKFSAFHRKSPYHFATYVYDYINSQWFNLGNDDYDIISGSHDYTQFTDNHLGYPELRISLPEEIINKHYKHFDLYIYHDGSYKDNGIQSLIGKENHLAYAYGNLVNQISFSGMYSTLPYAEFIIVGTNLIKIEQYPVSFEYKVVFHN